MYGDISLQKNFQICVEGGSIQAFLQSKKLTKPKYMDELPFRAVIFDPFDMNLPYATPSARRDYIDDVLSRAYPSFGPVYRDYTHIMRQRNTLLKQIQK
jgi:recombinational DNA repair ATPase RecF